MTKMEQKAREDKLTWRVCVSGEPLGMTFNGDTCSMRDLNGPGAVPTEEAARRVAKAFKRWIQDRYPDKQDPRGAYFVASAEGPYKVNPNRRAESEQARRRIGNCFQDQGQAHQASLALAWLCARERERYETGHNEQVAGEQDRLSGALGTTAG